MARTPVGSAKQPTTDTQVAMLPGVVEVLSVTGTRQALATVVYERRRDQRALVARLGELGDIVEWLPVEERIPEAAISTFRDLARRAANDEDLLVDR